MCRDSVGYQVKWFDPAMQGYSGGIRLNGLIQICRVMVEVSG